MEDLLSKLSQCQTDIVKARKDIESYNIATSKREVSRMYYEGMRVGLNEALAIVTRHVDVECGRLAEAKKHQQPARGL